jgi:uncharacterized protein YaiI (UPF0178 family)
MPRTDWIVARVTRGDIVVTDDVPLVGRCIKAGAQVLGSSGRPFTESSIGMALGTRNLMDELRSAGQVTCGPKPFSSADRSRFLDALHQAIIRLKHEGF